MCVKHDQEPRLRTRGTIERKEVVCGRLRIEGLRRTGITSGLKLSFSVRSVCLYVSRRYPENLLFVGRGQLWPW